MHLSFLAKEILGVLISLIIDIEYISIQSFAGSLESANVFYIPSHAFYSLSLVAGFLEGGEGTECFTFGPTR